MCICFSLCRAGASPSSATAGRGLCIVICGPWRSSEWQKSPVAASCEARPERASRAFVPDKDGVARKRAPRQRICRDRGRFDAGQWGHPTVQTAPEARQPRLRRLLHLHEGSDLDGQRGSRHRPGRGCHHRRTTSPSRARQTTETSPWLPQA